jgi:hypothetical protein
MSPKSRTSSVSLDVSGLPPLDIRVCTDRVWSRQRLPSQRSPLRRQPRQQAIPPASEGGWRIDHHVHEGRTRDPGSHLALSFFRFFVCPKSTDTPYALPGDSDSPNAASASAANAAAVIARVHRTPQKLTRRISASSVVLVEGTAGLR